MLWNIIVLPEEIKKVIRMTVVEGCVFMGVVALVTNVTVLVGIQERFVKNVRYDKNVFPFLAVCMIKIELNFYLSATCTEICLNGGMCNDNGRCSCIYGFGGRRCEIGQ